MRRSVDTDKLMDGLGRLATDTDLCKRYGNCTPWIPYSAVRKLISDMILEEKESCDDTVSRKAMLEKIRSMQTYKLFSGDDMILIDKAEVQTELMMLPPVQPDIIRCKDCAYCDSDVVDAPYGMTKKIFWCDRLYAGANENLVVDPDDFCSWAERREDG